MPLVAASYAGPLVLVDATSGHPHNFPAPSSLPDAYALMSFLSLLRPTVSEP